MNNRTCCPLAGYYAEQERREKKLKRRVRCKTIKEIWLHQFIMLLTYCSIGFICWDMGFYEWLNEVLHIEAGRTHLGCVMAGMIIVWLVDTILSYRSSFKENYFIERPFFTTFGETYERFKWHDD